TLGIETARFMGSSGIRGRACRNLGSVDLPVLKPRTAREQIRPPRLKGLPRRVLSSAPSGGRTRSPPGCRLNRQNPPRVGRSRWRKSGLFGARSRAGRETVGGPAPTPDAHEDPAPHEIDQVAEAGSLRDPGDLGVVLRRDPAPCREETEGDPLPRADR